MVGDPIGFTEILFKGRQNNFYWKKISDEELWPPPSSIQMSILFFDNKFGWGEDPPFQTMSKIS